MGTHGDSLVMPVKALYVFWTAAIITFFPPMYFGYFRKIIPLLENKWLSLFWGKGPQLELMPQSLSKVMTKWICDYTYALSSAFLCMTDLWKL